MGTTIATLSETIRVHRAQVQFRTVPCVRRRNAELPMHAPADRRGEGQSEASHRAKGQRGLDVTTCSRQGSGLDAPFRFCEGSPSLYETGDRGGSQPIFAAGQPGVVRVLYPPRSYFFRTTLETTMPIDWDHVTSLTDPMDVATYVLENSDDALWVKRALSMAKDGTVDGAHHKMWVIDQMVRALLGCEPDPVMDDLPEGYNGYTENSDYRTWVKQFCAGKDGPDTYSWDEGIAP